MRTCHAYKSKASEEQWKSSYRRMKTGKASIQKSMLKIQIHTGVNYKQKLQQWRKANTRFTSQQEIKPLPSKLVVPAWVLCVHIGPLYSIYTLLVMLFITRFTPKPFIQVHKGVFHPQSHLLLCSKPHLTTYIYKDIHFYIWMCAYIDTHW